MLIFFMDPCPDCLRLSDMMGDHTMSCWMDGSWISTAGHYIIVLLIARNPLTNFLRGKKYIFFEGGGGPVSQGAQGAESEIFCQCGLKLNIKKCKKKGKNSI